MVKVPEGYVVTERRVNIALWQHRDCMYLAAFGKQTSLLLSSLVAIRKITFPTSKAALQVPETMLIYSRKDAASGPTAAPGQPRPPPALLHLVVTRAIQVNGL